MAHQAPISYQGKPNTLRKVHSSWTQFFAYCTDVKGLYPANPMAKVTRPGVQGSPIRFFELDVVERIIDYQPTAERRALFALLYGTGIEVSVALALTRADVWEATKEIRAAGTKAHSRDRVCRVADWAWEAVWGHCRLKLPWARLWPAWNRWTVSDWHRETVEGLELPRHLSTVPGITGPCAPPERGRRLRLSRRNSATALLSSPSASTAAFSLVLQIGTGGRLKRRDMRPLGAVQLAHRVRCSSGLPSVAATLS